MADVAELRQQLAYVGIAERIRRGDADAEIELYRYFQKGLRAIVRRNCRPGEAQIEDIVHDVMVDVLQRLRAGSIQDLTALPSYLRVAIERHCVVHYRRQLRLVDDSGEVSPPLADSDPLQDVYLNQQIELVRQVIADLPTARDREVLRRSYLMDQDSDQICHALGIDTGHLRRVIHRARERLRAALQRRRPG